MTPYEKHSDDMNYASLLQARMAFNKRKLGGGAGPLLENKMIRTTFPYCKHGDDMMLLFIASMDGLKKSRGAGRKMICTYIHIYIHVHSPAEGTAVFAGPLLSFHVHWEGQDYTNIKPSILDRKYKPLNPRPSI